MKRRWAVMLTAALACGGAAAARADEAVDVEQLYGARIKAALAKRDTADDLALAKEMFDAAGAATATPKLLGALCDRVYLLAQRDEAGFETAIAAMSLRGTYLPDTRADCAARALSLAQRRFATAKGEQKNIAGDRLIDVLTAQAEVSRRAGDYTAALVSLRRAQTAAAGMKSVRTFDIQIATDLTLHRQMASQRLAELTAALKADPHDKTAAMAMVKLLVVDFDDPAGAAKYADVAGDGAWKEHLELALTAPGKLTDAQYLGRAAWWRGLAADASPAAQGPLLQHAHRDYMQFVVRHAPDEPERKKIEAVVTEIENKLSTLNVEIPPAPGQIDTPSRGGTFFGVPTGQ